MLLKNFAVRHYLILHIVGVFLNSACFSQAVEPSTGVASKILQIEMEGLFTNEKEGAVAISSWLIPNALARYGISNNVELQLNVPYLRERFQNKNTPAYTLHRFDDAQIGTSINLWKQHHYIPEAALMIRIILPLSNGSFKKFGEIVALNFSNRLSNKLSFNYNFGYIRNLSNINTGYYIVNISYEPNSRWHFYIENTGEFNEGEKMFELVNGGFGINLKNNFTTDLSIGKGINKNAYYFGIIITPAIDTANT